MNPFITTYKIENTSLDFNVTNGNTEFFAGISASGCTIICAIENLNLAGYKELIMDFYCKNNNESLNNFFVGLAERSTLNKRDGGWNENNIALISSEKLKNNKVNKVKLDLTKVNSVDLANVCIYVRVNSGYSGGGIWINPVRIEAR